MFHDQNLLKTTLYSMKKPVALHLWWLIDRRIFTSAIEGRGLIFRWGGGGGGKRARVLYFHILQYYMIADETLFAAQKNIFSGAPSKIKRGLSLRESLHLQKACAMKKKV